jgi:hypothetical protein
MSLDRSELQIEDSTETATQSIEDSILPFEHEIVSSLAAATIL